MLVRITIHLKIIDADLLFIVKIQLNVTHGKLP